MGTTTAKTCRVGLLGFGNVNQAFVKHYLSIAASITRQYKFSLQFVAICDSTGYVDSSHFDVDELMKKKAKGLLPYSSAHSLDEMMDRIQNGCIDILIDGLPTSKKDEGSTYPLLTAALKSGVHVICANKSPLAFKGAELLELAHANKASIGLSGATAGCLPTAGVMMHELAGSGIAGIRGVLNGTSNYVLDAMCGEGLTIKQAIDKAIDLGIAEPDYEDDLSGMDTAYKLIILALLLTGIHVHPDTVPCRGVMDIEQSVLQASAVQGKALRLIGTCEIQAGCPHLSVAPEELSAQDPLYAVSGAGKGITFRTLYMGELTIIGSSSGRTHIAAALLKDIINACKE